MTQIAIISRLGDKPYLHGGAITYLNPKGVVWMEYTPGLGNGVVIEPKEFKERMLNSPELLIYQWPLIEAIPIWSTVKRTTTWPEYYILLGEKYGFNLLDPYPRISSFRELKEFWQCK